jgi:hypothetical protein
VGCDFGSGFLEMVLQFDLGIAAPLAHGAQLPGNRCDPRLPRSSPYLWQSAGFSLRQQYWPWGEMPTYCVRLFAVQSGHPNQNVRWTQE